MHSLIISCDFVLKYFPKTTMQDYDGTICNVYLNYLNYVLVKLFFTDSLCACIYFICLLYLSTIVGE